MFISRKIMLIIDINELIMFTQVCHRYKNPNFKIPTTLLNPILMALCHITSQYVQGFNAYILLEFTSTSFHTWTNSEGKFAESCVGSSLYIGNQYFP